MKLQEVLMPVTPKQMEKILFSDGWIVKNQVGSHRHYTHPTKKGEVTIPFHSKSPTKRLDHSIYKQANLKK